MHKNNLLLYVVKQPELSKQTSTALWAHPGIHRECYIRGDNVHHGCTGLPLRMQSIRGRGKKWLVHNGRIPPPSQVSMGPTLAKVGRLDVRQLSKQPTLIFKQLNKYNTIESRSKRVKLATLLELLSERRHMIDFPTRFFLYEIFHLPNLVHLR